MDSTWLNIVYVTDISISILDLRGVFIQCHPRERLINKQTQRITLPLLCLGVTTPHTIRSSMNP